MGLNKQKGNMYGFVTHTFNMIKGECSHRCKYCYMKKWGKQKPIHFDESELKTDLGAGNFIFVGSSTDILAKNVPATLIKTNISYCANFYNKYLFQTKNPARYFEFIHLLNDEYLFLKSNIILATTIETNRYTYDLSKTPPMAERAYALGMLSRMGFETMVTIEPIMDFDTNELIHLIRVARPTSINIGADSGGNNLPEPSKAKVLKFIEYIKKETSIKINEKKNLGRLLK